MTSPIQTEDPGDQVSRLILVAVDRLRQHSHHAHPSLPMAHTFVVSRTFQDDFREALLRYLLPPCTWRRCLSKRWSIHASVVAGRAAGALDAPANQL
jgi:hypothetical protein